MTEKKRITTDSPYYKYASELIQVVRANPSMTSRRLAEYLEETIGDFIDFIDWCSDCERMDHDQCMEYCQDNYEPRINEGYL